MIEGVLIAGMLFALAGVVFSLAALVSHDEGGRKKRDKDWDEGFRVARELRALVDQAKLYGLPLVVDPTRTVRGQIVYPIIGEGATGQNGSTLFDENGVPL